MGGCCLGALFGRTATLTTAIHCAVASSACVLSCTTVSAWATIFQSVGPVTTVAASSPISTASGAGSGVSISPILLRMVCPRRTRHGYSAHTEELATSIDHRSPGQLRDDQDELLACL